MNATCHPDKPNKSRGLCMNCYAKSRAVQRLAWQRANPDKVAAAKVKYLEALGEDERKRQQREYAREWRSRPENAQRQRESNKRSRERAKAADPEGFKARQKARYEKFKAANPDARAKHYAKDRARLLRQRTDLTFKRRGVTLAEFVEYWKSRGMACDICRGPLEQPGVSRAVVADHDRDHCDRKIGCRDCVRGLLHRECNTLEGAIRKAQKVGILTGIWGPVAAYIADPPFQRWAGTEALAA